MRFHLLILFFLYAAKLSTIKGSAPHVPVPVEPHLAKLGLGPTGTRDVYQPAKSCKCVAKRSQGPVQSALRNSKASQFIGGGMVGRVFATTFQGQKAVIKITRRGAPGGSRKQIEEEVIYLRAVNQFLGWGRNADNSIFYIVMRDMGRPYQAIKPQIPANQAEELIHQAIARYEQEFHMANKDLNLGNFVFHKVGGVWRAEIIDWANGDRLDGARILSAGEPEVVQEYDPDDHVQGCGCVVV
ncbi:hypothetical protein J132_11140 [Termitomyces sp. J132]|nr:hypothetical protein J132_11140 [Termitomyces sp. J132]